MVMDCKDLSKLGLVTWLSILTVSPIERFGYTDADALQIFSNLDKTLHYIYSTKGHVLNATTEFHYAAKDT
jgi:hypothetical protein